MIADRTRIALLDIRCPQIATGDLDIAVVGQLLMANFPLGDEFEPSLWLS
jgi:hypothetical protein